MAGFKRRLADSLGSMFGVHIVTRKGAAYWPERYFVDRLFARLKPDCVLDVGANKGQYARGIRAQGYRGTILSFEPNPAAYERLVAAAAMDAHWHAYPLALRKTPGVASFNVMTDDVFSSFRQPLDGPDISYQVESRISDTVDVQVERLETMLPLLAREHGFINPFLKMDTQGFDLEVFDGAGSESARFCGLLSEISVREIYADSPDMHESLERFKAAGFTVAALHSVHPGLPLKPIEFNCYCVRSDLAEADQPD